MDIPLKGMYTYVQYCILTAKSNGCHDTLNYESMEKNYVFLYSTYDIF